MVLIDLLLVVVGCCAFVDSLGDFAYLVVLGIDGFGLVWWVLVLWDCCLLC